MQNTSLKFLTATLLLMLNIPVFATNNKSKKQKTKDAVLKIDSVKSANEVLSYYELQRATQRCKYAKTKENIAVLKYLKSLKWTEQEKLEIFKLYQGTYFTGEVNETKINTETSLRGIRITTDFNWKKLEERVLVIAGKEGAKIFWKNFEKITNQFTDITKF